MPPNIAQDTSCAPQDLSHELRITNHGKINGWVSFALDHFKVVQKYANRPLVLHTLPVQKPNLNLPTQDVPAENTTVQVQSDVKAVGQPQRMNTSMSTIPRLISVVEIIKREYLNALDPVLAEAGCLSGLHQYNEIGELQEHSSIEGSANEGEDRLNMLAHALQGRGHLKQQKVAFMRVTLCQNELPELIVRGATYQRPVIRKLPKSSRVRAKRKLRKLNAELE
ncbi:hypothetical protein A0H81_07461 [Grifola frondosa]|uniref:Uncharacterized protein n=1 Tax=Grifola frondosa TaxID=5627 RepID=A0A1C7M5M3_GRIFR|nr:hypothetical protein A0H81_07461 [Grifola frondosa]